MYLCAVKHVPIVLHEYKALYSLPEPSKRSHSQTNKLLIWLSHDFCHAHDHHGQGEYT